MTRLNLRILSAFAAFVFILFASFAYSQEAAREIDASLLNLPTDRDASFYRETFEKLSAGAHDVLHTAKSFPDLVRDVTPFATSAKVVFERLASSTDADDVACCGKAFDLYVIWLTFGDRTDEINEFLTNDAVANHPKLADKAKKILAGGEPTLTRFKITFGMLAPFDYACEREDGEAIRNFSVLIVEQAETVDWLVDELDYVVSHTAYHDQKFAQELCEKIFAEFADAQDAKRRELREKIAKVLEEYKRSLEAEERYGNLMGNEILLEGLLLDTTELDWSSYRGKVTLVALGAFKFDVFPATFPKLLQFYRQYHDSGFETLIYCADFDMDYVQDFQDEVKLPWKIACRRRNQECKEAGGKEYVSPFEYYRLVDSILKPRFILVDRDGKVLSVEAQKGDRLEKLLQKEFPEVKEPSQETIDACQIAVDALFTRLTKPYEDALKKNSKDYEALHHMAHVVESFGRKEEAFEMTKKAFEMAPKDVELLNCMAFQLATNPDDSVRDGKRALEYAERAARMSEYEVHYILDTLAAAYAEVGDFENAVKWAKKALRLATLEGLDIDELQSYQDAVKLYNNKKPRRGE